MLRPAQGGEGEGEAAEAEVAGERRRRHRVPAALERRPAALERRHRVPAGRPALERQFRVVMRLLGHLAPHGMPQSP